MTAVSAAAPGAVVPVDRVTRWLARLGVLVVAIVLFRMGFELWWVGRIHEHLWVQVLVASFYLGGLVFLGLAAINFDHRKVDKVGFFVLLQALAAYAIISVTVVNRAYTSDALLFVHQAAEILLQGNNPYTANLIGGYEQFEVPYYVQTPTSTGGFITNLNYPALAVLLYTPFVAMGVPDLRPVSLGFLLVLVSMLYLGVPRHLRLLVPAVLFLSSFFLAFSISGFDILFVFFLIAALIMWDKRPRDAMIFFGLACAVKQTVWFIAPFLLVALWMDHRHLDWRGRARVTATGASVGLLAFLIPNVPFIVWNPSAWATGVLTPFGLGGDSLVPLSQGLTVFFYTGALVTDTFLLHLLAGIVLLTLLALYIVRYERLRMLAWLVPPFVLAFSERSLQNYFEMFYPVAIFVLLQTYPLLGADPEPRPRPSAAPGPARNATVVTQSLGGTRP